jgi:hypothetical protein
VSEINKVSSTSPASHFIFSAAPYVHLTYIQFSGSLKRLASLLQTWPQHVNATRQLVGLSRCFAGHCSVCTNVKACLRSVAATWISSVDENGSSCTSSQRDHQGTCLPPHSLQTPDLYPTGPSRQQHPFGHDLFNEIESSPQAPCLHLVEGGGHFLFIPTLPVRPIFSSTLGSLYTRDRSLCWVRFHHYIR